MQDVVPPVVEVAWFTAPPVEDEPPEPLEAVVFEAASLDALLLVPPLPPLEAPTVELPIDALVATLLVVVPPVVATVELLEPPLPATAVSPAVGSSGEPQAASGPSATSNRLDRNPK